MAERMRNPRAEQIWQWAERTIVFRPPYVSMEPGSYDSSLTPFFREPMERVCDRTTREVWLVKFPQCGASENVLLMPMRHAVDCDPKTVVYISGDQKATEEYLDERIKPGLQLSPSLRRRWAQVREKQYQIYYPDMMIIAGWAKNPSIFKQRPVDLALADEVAIWPSFSADELRRRMGTRPFSTLVGISSLSASRKGSTKSQPIMVEYRATNQCLYNLPDPRRRNKKTREWFTLEMGWKDQKSGRESPHGLKWSQDAKRKDGTWDVEAVMESAYYKTPYGSVINDDMLAELIQEGRWIPTNRNADPTKWGGRINCLYAPWITWGQIAKTLLEAKAKSDTQGDKSALKVFIVEDLVEEWKDEISSLEDDIVMDRQGQYEKGACMSASLGVCNEAGESFKEVYEDMKRMVLVTADVQKGYGYWNAREWTNSGDSGLIDWGEWHTWEQLNDIANKLKANHVLVDSGYEERSQETYQACLKYKFVPTMGVENIKGMLFVQNKINPFEGSRRQPKNRRQRKQQIVRLDFRTDPFKSQLMSRIKGETAFAWYVYHNIELAYCQQVTSEEKIDGNWEPFGPNHLWDCEVLQLLGAVFYGYNPLREPAAEEEKGAAD